jgi:hypothetical protein
MARKWWHFYAQCGDVLLAAEASEESLFHPFFIRHPVLLRPAELLPLVRVNLALAMEPIQ